MKNASNNSLVLENLKQDYYKKIQEYEKKMNIELQALKDQMNQKLSQVGDIFSDELDPQLIKIKKQYDNRQNEVDEAHQTLLRKLRRKVDDEMEENYFNLEQRVRNENEENLR